MRRWSKSFENVRVGTEKILCCALCFDVDLAFPDGMDPEETDAQLTEWVRCATAVYGYTMCVVVRNRSTSVE
ncbi:unnamed protein product [Heligmosomoides polygyrus]|uniref:DUF3330 domain-containing protein n=1 Tax=Heligmosomoides polygyrus TaxID=6339 RepID=A0A183F804_HELPZ|nr:unnamed protein product [Heligmosomoides polygyrus]